MSDTSGLSLKLQSISEALDHIIGQHSTIILMLLIVQIILLAGFYQLASALGAATRALLVDVTSWHSFEDVKFDIRPNGHVIVRTEDGLQTLKSVRELEKFLGRRMKQQGRSFDVKSIEGLLHA